MPMDSKLLLAADFSTLAKRRKAVSLVLDMLGRVQAAEAAYMDRMPANLQNGDAFAEAEMRIDAVMDAMDALADIY